MPKLSINLVTWNGAKYIAHLFNSLKNQTFKDWELVAIDNASTDITPELVPWIAKINNLPLRYVINKENFGFAKAHNQAIAKNQDEYVLVLNQDIYLGPDCLEKLVTVLDDHADVAAVAPRLMRWDLPATPAVEPEVLVPIYIETTFTNIIDSLGLQVRRNRRVVDIGAGEVYQPGVVDDVDSRFRGNDKKEVFGVSGACVMYRRKAIESIAIDGAFFDENYGSYKEDVDVAFRLRSFGSKSYTILNAVAYHDRTAAGRKEKSDGGAVDNKKNQSDLIKYNSYKNHLITLYKNEYWQNFILDFPWIMWYEVKKLGYFLLYDRAVLAGLGDIWRERKALKLARKSIISNRKISWPAMRQWFT